MHQCNRCNTRRTYSQHASNAIPRQRSCCHTLQLSWLALCISTRGSAHPPTHLATKARGPHELLLMAKVLLQHSMRCCQHLQVSRPLQRPGERCRALLVLLIHLCMAHWGRGQEAGASTAVAI
jgi:hypothetical protein